ncbi:hypothetical protein [Rhodopseudomonas sp. RCAM05734]|uniref:hypothetical protein n=1 Tax=Rhodopseudomonas sp. RCAM05734 TaxID=3457549 RepID=UPI004044BE5D
MPIQSQIDPIGSTIQHMIDQSVSPKARSQLFADFVKGGIAEASEANRQLGVTAPPIVTVDGQRGASIDSVEPDGNVVAEWETATPAVRWIWNALRERSPRLTGRYRDSHKLSCDGHEIAFGDEIPLARTYVFTNPEPYAHKIEIGKTHSGRDFEINVPNRIYERVASLATVAFPDLDIAFDDSGKSPSITITAKVA